MAPHSSILAWEIPWMEEPGRLQSMTLLRAGHDLSFLPTSHSIPPLQVVTEHQAKLLAPLYGDFPLAICFTYSNAYISMLLSQFIPLSPSPTVSLRLFLENVGT